MISNGLQGVRRLLHYCVDYGRHAGDDKGVNILIFLCLNVDLGTIY
jgi:hypothetical protein